MLIMYIIYRPNMANAFVTQQLQADSCVDYFRMKNEINEIKQSNLEVAQEIQQLKSELTKLKDGSADQGQHDHADQGQHDHTDFRTYLETRKALMSVVKKMTDLETRPMSERRKVKECDKLFSEIVNATRTDDSDVDLEQYCGLTDIAALGAATLNSYKLDLTLSMVADFLGRNIWVGNCECSTGEGAGSSKRKRTSKRYRY